VINAITNDLNMYMWGSSIGKGDNGFSRNPDAPSPIEIAPRIQPWPYDALNRDNEDGLRSQSGQGRSMENGRETIDCAKFKKDLKDVGNSPLLPLRIR